MNAKCSALNLLRLAGATIIIPTAALANAEAFQAPFRRDKVLKGHNINKISRLTDVNIKISYREKNVSSK